jgi:chromosome segregation ATPase
MKRTIGIIIACILTASLIQAQTDEILTNSSVIKMTKARLSDELIIDMIKTSQTNFDLSEDAIQNLKTENVSGAVIKEMQNAFIRQTGSNGKTISASQTTPTEKKPDYQKQVQETPKPAVSTPEDNYKSQVIEALGYVAPAKDLVNYYETEFEMMSVTISEWDRQIKSSLTDAENINEQILQTEKELREKINADAKNYNSEILLLNKKLVDNRAKYKQIKDKMLQDGENFTKKLAEISKEKERSLGKKYDEVSQQIKSFEADPSKAGNTVSVTFNKLIINDKTTYFISPSTELLYWHQNELYALRDFIAKWNIRVEEIVRQNTELNNKLEPLESQMQQYKVSPKQFKSEISSLKKQINSTEKEKKQLAWKMGNDSSEMAGELKKMCEDIQNSAKERFTDIIANINYYYQEKLNL